MKQLTIHIKDINGTDWNIRKINLLKWNENNIIDYIQVEFGSENMSMYLNIQDNITYENSHRNLKGIIIY